MHSIKGYYYNSKGYCTRPGTLTMTDEFKALDGVRFIAKLEPIYCGGNAIVIRRDSDSSWAFRPDKGECERIGMKVKKS